MSDVKWFQDLTGLGLTRKEEMTAMVYDEIVQSILIIVERLDLSSSKPEAADSGVCDACRGKKFE